MAKKKEVRAVIEKVPTGIQGFDNLVEGGFPRNSVILLSGTPGTGKTIFSIQFLVNGALMYGEKGMMVMVEEKAQALKQQASMFGWDLDDLEKRGLLVLMQMETRSIKGMTSEQIRNYANQHGIKRLVIDSLSGLAINTPNVYMEHDHLSNVPAMRFIYNFINELRADGMTAILISQTKENELARDTVSDFVSDGIVYIKYESMGGDYSRYLTVRKMRSTRHDEDIHPMEIGKEGIKVHNMK